MKKNGFTLVEIIVCLVLLSVIATTFILTTSKKEDKSKQVSEVEKILLNAADVLINLNSDNKKQYYLKQLNLGSQGVKIKLTKLIEEGLIEEKILDTLYNELKKEDSSITKEEVNNYYILIVKGSFEDTDDKCNGLSYYLSWKEFDNTKRTLYLCGNLPGKSAKKSSNVYITERSGLESYLYYYEFNLKDEEGNIISQNADGKYNLTYGEKYYIEFTEDALYNSYYFDLWTYNSDKNFVYLTLDNIPENESDTSYSDTVYYDLSNYFTYEKPQYSIDYLRNKVFDYNYFRPASELLNYNYITPYPISYKMQTANSDSFYNDADWSSYCYGTDYTYDTKARTYKLSGTVTCKSYSRGDTAMNGKYTIRSTNKTGTSSTMYKINKHVEGDYYSGKIYSFIVDELDDGYYYDYDDYGTTYFYRGDIKNNYISFAGYLWRIIRVNGDGSFRLILEGDIGPSKWNDSNKFEYYTGYTYGAVDYYPLMSSSTDSTRYDIDYTNTYCYSTSFKYNSSSNTYQLTGDIKCEKITTDNYYEKFNNKYTLHKTSKNDTSKTMYKLNGRYDNRRHYLYVYNTENQAEFDPYYETCYGSDYEIVNGSYKLKGTITCDVNLSSSNYKSYKNKYTVYKNTKDGTNTKMYKFIDCPNCKSGTWSRYDEFNHRFYQAPVYMYTNSNDNVSNIKKTLEDWYKANLKDYSSFITNGIFCNDTSKTITNSYYSSFNYNASSRLTGSNKTPTFKCDGTFEYGGRYNLNIGLISADELAFAGGAYNAANSTYYLAYNKSFWTMTPASKTTMFTSNIYESSESYSGSTGYIGSDGYWNEVDTDEEWAGCSDGSLDCETSGGYYHAAVNYNIFSSTSLNTSTTSVYQYDGDASIVVRPVINLTSSAIVYSDGDGTYGNPYVVDTKWEDLYYLQMRDWWY